MEEMGLKVERRTGVGKSTARKLRSAGMFPAVLYGRDTESLSISVGAKEWERLQKHMKRNAILDLELHDGELVDHRAVMVKEIQREYVTHRVTHVDFLQVSMERMVEVEISIVLQGISKGVLNNGVIEQHLHTISAECLPTKIPEQIEIDITDLDIGDSFHVSDISIPGVRVLEAQGVAIVTISPPTVEQAAPAAAETEKKE